PILRRLVHKGGSRNARHLHRNCRPLLGLRPCLAATGNDFARFRTPVRRCRFLFDPESGDRNRACFTHWELTTLYLEKEIWSVDEESIFAAALGKVSPSERLAFLAEVCAGDPELRAGVEALLQAHENPDSFLEPSGARLDPGVAEETVVQPMGTMIGPYRLLQQLGEGGMGAVFRAEQTQPVQRQVALKLIRSGLDSAQLLARFEAERQALALMDHPHIARVLDAGTTPEGRPFFVMELVEGVSITRYCDEQHLTLRQ